MAFRIQIRRDISAKWALNNPILLEGEIGYETNTSYIKIGDGVTPWNDLSYWTGGVTGAGLIVKENGATVLSPTNVLNFSTDFDTTVSSGNTVSISLSGVGPNSTSVNVFGEDGIGITGATGLNFRSSKVTASGKNAYVTPLYTPYFSVTASLSGGNFSSFSSSRGPDGQSLTGPSWNYVLSNSGNDLTITHNEGMKVIGLATHATNGSNTFVKTPVGTSVSQFALTSNSANTAFTVYTVNSALTGASSSGNVEIIWTFGATL